MSVRRVLPWYAAAAAVVALDQASKAWASAALVYGQPVPVLPVFDLTLLHNTGAAFSMLADQGGWQRWAFLALALGVAGLLATWLWRMPDDGRRVERWAFALVMGGALGNGVDRLRFGHVVDFLHFHWDRWYFPAFNLADSALTVGAVLLVVDALFGPPAAARA